MADDEENSPASRGALGGSARAANLTTERKAEIAKQAAAARWKNRGQPATTSPNKNNNLLTIAGIKPAAPVQPVLDLGIERQIEIDGVGMGVLSDGTPFLTGRGLARLCGVGHGIIQDLTAEWSEEPAKVRVASIKKILAERGLLPESPYLPIKQRSGTFFAYPDSVCLAVLEYYAFDAGLNVKEEAKKNFRLLAGKALQDFIYTQVGYDPTHAVPDEWKQFHDRVSLTYNSVPHGYFSIFKEMADMIVTLGQAGLHIDSSFVPDISVGIHWGKHWVAKGFDTTLGARIKYQHNYPAYFPQAESNPQEPWCYPDTALAEFRRWVREDYIGQGKFSTYITGKVAQKQLPASFAQLAIAAYTGGDED